MDFQAVLDPASIIWDEQDFQINSTKYYLLAENLQDFIEIWEKHTPYLLIRQEMLNELLKEFPAQGLMTQFPQFHYLNFVLYRFLARIGEKICEFYNFNDSIISEPNIQRAYFNNNTKREVTYLISEIHLNIQEYKFFTFSLLWPDHKPDLKTSLNNDTVIHDTIIYDSNNTLNQFFEAYRRVFEPNPKHDRKKGYPLYKGKANAKLSCFNGQNLSVPQKLLDSSVKYKDSFYNYDSSNNVFVIFRPHLELQNKYHAYDIDLQDVPNEVKRIFHK